MGTHSTRHCFLICPGTLIDDLTNFLVANQSFKNVFLMFKRVSAQSGFVRNKTRYALSMLTRNYGMVELRLVIVEAGVFKVKLDHFKTISECVKRHLFALHNGNKIISSNLASMSLVYGNRLQVSLQNVVVFKLTHADSTSLSVEEVGCIKHCLSFVPTHFGKEIGIL
jgi:hypothetical protein